MQIVREITVFYLRRDFTSHLCFCPHILFPPSYFANCHSNLASSDPAKSNL